MSTHTGALGEPRHGGAKVSIQSRVLGEPRRRYSEYSGAGTVNAQAGYGEYSGVGTASISSPSTRSSRSTSRKSPTR